MRLRSTRVLMAMLMVGLGAAARGQVFAYEVATIRPNLSGSANLSIDSNNSTFVAVNMQPATMICEAFDLQTNDEVLGLPAWAAAAHYDLNAKLDAETAARLKTLTGDDRNKAEDELMLRLLVDRFGLKYHREKRELPEYALVQVKGGSLSKPGLRVADPAQSKAKGMHASNGKMESHSVSMESLAYFLSYQPQVHRRVVDKTGLAGMFDLNMAWSRDDLNSSADGTTERAPGLFTALQEQMGLKLESIKGPVDVVVIDHIEQPTEN